MFLDLPKVRLCRIASAPYETSPDHLGLGYNVVKVRSLVSAVSTTHPSRHNFLVDLNGLVSEEGRVAGSHLVHKHAQRPPVHRLVVPLQLSVVVDF